MEQVFLFVIDYLKKGVENNYTLYFIIAFTLTPIFSFLIETVLILFSKKSLEGEFYKSVTSLSLLLLTIFSVSSFATNQLVFKSAIEVFYYNASMVLFCLAMLLTLKLILNKRVKETAIIAEQEERVENVKIEPTNVKRIVETITCKTANEQEYSGYLNVEYLKTLIDKLKQNDLEEQELLEVEDLEVYLLNFITRQPTASERQVLSNYIGLLLKKLAKYNVVNE